MALTRDVKATVHARLRGDPNFREALLQEGIESMLAGDVATGKTLLRHYIEATVGFERIGAEAGLSAKRLVRMFEPASRPTARNLLTVIRHLQRCARLTLKVTVQSR